MVHMSTEPIQRARTCAEQIERLRTEMAAVRRDRRAAILAARETMTAAEVAKALGISRARVYAIAAGRE